MFNDLSSKAKEKAANVVSELNFNELNGLLRGSSAESPKIIPRWLESVLKP